ncbi:MAG: TetR family transcriptional regulator C-terminal domain-containing protein, partial [Rhodobacteraceae bacterium]|nr:TetR family transcriptional regulator C-terminal domain-containing protein [Paracoccaceae bacterium]
GRLRSNLVQSLRPLVGARAGDVAHALGAMIDGVYIREALKAGAPDGSAAAAVVLDCLDRELEAGA